MTEQDDRRSLPGVAVESRLVGGRLIVDGARFIVVGAELHNSSSSTAAAIRTSFSRAAALGANTILAPVAWDLFEPEEGVFDHALIDGMLDEARRLGVRLIILWFGSWKNGMSSYAPSWIKLDAARFPRAEVAPRGRIEHLSPFGRQSRAADARAFAALMAHLRENDPQRTTIMVQVENECGLLTDARDRSPLAEAAWRSAVPKVVVNAVAAATAQPLHAVWVDHGERTEGTWSELFGTSDVSEESFMAYACADYVEEVAAAGRAEHDVPLFVNAWLDTAHGTGDDSPATTTAGGARPGEYPSGGPLVRVAPIWRAVAPTIDLLAPDVYLGDFRAICEAYREASGALFIPEMQRGTRSGAQMMLAVGELGAIGVSPFGVDSLAESEPEWAQLADAYAQLRAVAESLRRFPDATSRGFVLDGDHPNIELEFNGFTLRIDTGPKTAASLPTYPSYGVAIEERPGQVLVVGRGFMVFFGDSTGRPAGILSADEISGTDGLTVTRHLNGDETFSGKFAIFPNRDSVSAPTGQPISISSDMTGIVRYRLYRF